MNAMKIEKISPTKYIVSPQGGSFDAYALLCAINECQEGTEFVFEPGNYYFDAPESAVKLCDIQKSISFKAKTGARFIGGKSLFGAALAIGETGKRFFPEAQNRVYCIDLKDNGINQTSGFVSRGFGRAVAPSHSEIFADGVALNLSRYPKNGYLKIAGYAKEETNVWSQKVGKLDKGFLCPAATGRPSRPAT
ncbi:MAG: hypothetical protein FWH48_04195 [Oscillospiraceae bacterium]|nr:hypothetical protein [Oscillospiraceae bacterium]